MRALAAEGSAVLYSTHYLPEVEELGAKVAILDSGQIIIRGDTDELIADHGHAVVELSFDGPAPVDRFAAADSTAEGSVVRVTTPRPAAAAARILAELGPDAARLEGVEIVRPSLDSVFLALTGRRYDGDASTDEAPAPPDRVATGQDG